MPKGDLVLYKSSGKWYERAIVLATQGPYVHVGILIEDHQVLAARTSGIGYDVFKFNPAYHTLVSLVPQYTTQEDVNKGLRWAVQQVGKQYGWMDILYQAVKFLNPNGALRFYEQGHYDCSDFCTRYLQQAGVPLPASYADSYTVTPNDLARFFGLIPPRKGAA